VNLRAAPQRKVACHDVVVLDQEGRDAIALSALRETRAKEAIPLGAALMIWWSVRSR
jgi:hypothetical protein